MEAFVCSKDPLDISLHNLRQHSGQQRVAQDISELLEGSEILEQPKKSIQDPYSFRCVPQVHGASLHAIDHVSSTVRNEINAVTDNPNIFAVEDKILSGGNFHAQPLALVLDYLAIALAELGSISERRCFKLLCGLRDLPDYLTAHSGLNSGMMISQYTAAAIVSQNKQLASPCSVDTIDSSKGQEDHVSMAANGATRCYRIVENIYRILAIELMVAAQALEFRRPLKSSRRIAGVFSAYRKEVSKLENDRILADDINITIAFLKNNSF
jgi:histidine ammonia-lyase